jgi:hypothetical protein
MLLSIRVCGFIYQGYIYVCVYLRIYMYLIKNKKEREGKDKTELGNCDV